jgi:ferredoxin
VNLEKYINLFLIGIIMSLKIDYDKCCWKDGKCVSCGCGENSSCEGCVEVCPVGAIKRENVVKIDRDKCTECGACVKACPSGALSLG